MPRLARAVVSGAPYHVTQRGNNRQDVSFVDDGWRGYLDLLAEWCGERGVDIWVAFAVHPGLMANHVHLVAAPGRQDSLAKAVGRALRPRACLRPPQPYRYTRG